MQRRAVTTWLWSAPLLLLACGGAFAYELSIVSRGGDGDAVGDADSGSSPVFVEQAFPCPVSNDGAVTFVTAASFDDTYDGNQVLDIYSRTAAGHTELVSVGFDAVGHAEVVSSFGTGAVLLRQEVGDSLHTASTARGLFLWGGSGLQEERLFTADSSNTNCPAATSDGNYVVFTTDAALVEDDTNGGNDVYAAIRVGDSWVFQRMSVTATGVQILGDTMPLFDRSALLDQPLTRFGTPVVSYDDTYGLQVVFVSNGTNLPGASANTAYAYLRRVQGGTTETFRVGARHVTGETGDPGPCFSPDISGDGRLIVFVTDDPYIAIDTGADGKKHVYVTDRDGSLVNDTQPGYSLVDRTATGLPGNGDSLAPRLSGDGRFVVFRSRATDLVPSVGTKGKYQIYVHDRDTQTTHCVSAVAQEGGDADSYAPGISPTGRYVTFISRAANLGSDTGFLQVYRVDRGEYYANHPPTVADRQESTALGTPLELTLTGTDPDGDDLAFYITSLPDPAKGRLYDGTLEQGVQITATGEGTPYNLQGALVTYEPLTAGAHATSLGYKAREQGPGYTEYSNLGTITVQAAAGGPSSMTLLTDRYEGAAYVQNDDNSPEDLYSYAVGRIGVSGDGSRVLFTTKAQLVPTDTDFSRDAYLVVTIAEGKQTFLIDAGGSGNLDVEGPSLSPCGHYAAVTTWAALDPVSDTNVEQDVYLLDITDPESTSVELVSCNPGTGLALGQSHSPSVAVGGTRVSFVHDDQVYLWEQATRDIALISEDSSGVPSTAPCREPVIAGDGNVVAYVASAQLTGAPTDGHDCIYAYLVYADQTVLVSRPTGSRAAPDGASSTPSLSRHGSLVAFVSRATNLTGDDMNGNTRDVYVANLRDESLARLTDTASGEHCWDPWISGDGRFVYLTTAAELGDAPDVFHAGYTHAYVLDRRDGSIQMADVHAGESGAGDCGKGILTVDSATALQVIFTSAATNLVDNDTTDNDIFRATFGDVANSAPTPLAPDTVSVEAGSVVTVNLDAQDPDSNELLFYVTDMPEHGRLFDGTYDPVSGDGLEITGSQMPYLTLSTSRLFYVASDSYTGAESFGVTVSDVFGSETTYEIALEVTPPNQAPVIDLDVENEGLDYNVIFAVDTGGPTSATDVERLAIEDDDTTVVSATVTITNALDGENESLAADTGGRAIVVEYDAGVCVLTLTGEDTLAAYEALLATVTYDNVALKPDTTPRIITFTVSDGELVSEPAITTVFLADDWAELGLLPGWNLLSVPVDTPAWITPADLLCDIQGADLVVGDVWIWDAEQGPRYRAWQQSFAACQGFWAFHLPSQSTHQDATTTAPIPGRRRGGALLLQPGWNLVGPVEDVAKKNVVGIEVLSAPVWGWDSLRQTYESVEPRDTLEAGKGYWFYVQGNEPMELAFPIEGGH